MAKFNYRFESIKNVKKNLEKKSQKELADLDLKIDKVKKDIKDLEDKKNQIKINEKGKKTIKVSEAHTKIHYENYLNELIKVHQKMEDELNQERIIKLEELVTKSKEHKIFKKLEEKTKEEFFYTENKSQQHQLDDISIQKFVRKNS
jgi:flagellar export protein FliJ